MSGLAHGLRNETALRDEAVVLVVAIPAGVFLASSPPWYVAMIVAIPAVMALELLNTAIEKLADHVTPGHHPAIGAIKDYGSAAVLCAIVAAAGIWLAALLARLGFF